MTVQTIRRNTATSQKNTMQATPQRDKTTAEYKMSGNQNTPQKPTGATPWQHMTKRQHKNRRHINRLIALWPELFNREAPKPLKAGIFDDLMRDIVARGIEFGPGGITCCGNVICAVSALLPRTGSWWCMLRPERPAVWRGDTTGAAGRRNAADGAE